MAFFVVCFRYRLTTTRYILYNSADYIISSREYEAPWDYSIGIFFLPLTFFRDPFGTAAVPFRGQTNQAIE